MKDRQKEKGGGAKSPKREDDISIPKFVPDMDSKSSLFGSSDSKGNNNLPVFAMPRKYRIWRAVRVPLFVTIVVIILATVALITRSVTIAKNIKGTVDEAERAERLGTLQHLLVATKTLSKLAEKHSGSDLAQSAWAWQAVLNGLLLGPEQPAVKSAKEALEASDEQDSDVVQAARAGLALIEGNLQGALDDVMQGLRKHPGSPRLALVGVLTLGSQGRDDEARELFQMGRQTDGGYIPLLLAGVLFEADRENRAEALRLNLLLEKASPGHVLAALMGIKLALPYWGEPALDIEQTALLSHRWATLEGRVRAAPPKIAIYSHYLSGRLALARKNAKEAAAAFQQYLGAGKVTSEVLAWNAVALRAMDGSEKALQLLERYPDVTGKEVLDIRSQCLLEYHRVASATTAIEQLSKAGGLSEQIQNLRWTLAVRSGSVKQAMNRMPEVIGEESKWLAIEMYYLLKDIGDVEGLKALTTAMEENLSSCAKTIKIWHGKNLGRAIRLLGRAKNSDQCEYGFTARLMRGQSDVQVVADAAERVSRESGGSLLFEVDRALALWHTEGYAKALAIVDSVWAHKPEGVPLRSRLAEAYLEMDKPKKALEVLGDSENPELLHLRIEASLAAGNKKGAEKLRKLAIKRNSKNPHPALAYHALSASLKDGDVATVNAWVEDHMTDTLPGKWTSELAGLGAMALVKTEEKDEADKFLQKIARRVLPHSGTDEFLNTLKANIRIDLRRVGKYKNQALSMARYLRNERVEDPWLAYWLAVDSITGGSERIGLGLLNEALTFTPSFRPAFEKLIEKGWLNEDRNALMQKMRPYMKP